MRLPLLLSLALCITACSGSFRTGPQPGDRIPVELRVTPTGPTTGEPHTPTVATGPGRIVVEGQFITPNPCQSVDAVAQRNERGELVLAVTATAQDVMCIQSLANFTYTATLQDITPGGYHLVVVHATEGAGRQRHESRVLDTNVLVP